MESDEPVENKSIEEYFQSAYGHIRAQEDPERNSNNLNSNLDLNHAMIDLGRILEKALNEFYLQYFNSLTEDEQEKIDEKIKSLNRKSFLELSLGGKMDVLRSHDSLFVKKIEEMHNISLEQLEKIRDNDFVQIRNLATHDGKTKNGN